MVIPSYPPGSAQAQQMAAVAAAAAAAGGNGMAPHPMAGMPSHPQQVMAGGARGPIPPQQFPQQQMYRATMGHPQQVCVCVFV